MGAKMEVLLIQNPDALLQRALQNQGYAVFSAETLREADPESLARDGSLVVLDLDLCGAEGLDRVEAWRSRGLHTPVLVLVSGDAVDQKVQALDVGADAVVMKPYECDELLAQIRALLRRARPSETPVQKVRDLEIDPAGRTVKRAGKHIKLTRREFALLQFLVEHRGKVVSRSMIQKNVFDGRQSATSNAVNVHICSLRLKIDQGYDPPLIVTCYGEGYMLRDDA